MTPGFARRPGVTLNIRASVLEVVMEVVFAKDSVSVRWDGGVVRISKSQPWDATDPFVRANPSLFSADPALVARTRPYVAAPVEQATAAPGEKRNTARVRPS